MFDAISALVRSTFNKRGSSLSVPTMDGALKPNNLLEDAPVLAENPELEDIAAGPDGTIYAACGKAVVKVGADGNLDPVATFDHVVTALAVWPDGTISVGLGTTVIVDADKAKGEVVNTVDGRSFTAVTALHAGKDGALLICDGSAVHTYPDWSRDLLEKGRSGRLVRYDRAGRTATVVGSGLGYAFGAFLDGRGRTLVSESWRHQVSIVGNGKPTPGIPALPGYPARISPVDGGGFWLSVFANRTQLIEFVLRETDYRRDMMRTVEPKYWVAPALSSGQDFREPLQAGGVKQMGILKPWAPPRSYGLVVRYDADLMPLYSLHSRVGGRHHGVVAVAQRGDELLVLSKGAGRILRLSVSQVEGLGRQGAEE